MVSSWGAEPDRACASSEGLGPLPSFSKLKDIKTRLQNFEDHFGPNQWSLESGQVRPLGTLKCSVIWISQTSGDTEIQCNLDKLDLWGH